MRNKKFAFFTKSLNNTSFDTYTEEGWATAIRNSAQDPTAEVIIVRPEEWQPPVHKSIEPSELRDVMNSFIFMSRWQPILMKHGVSIEYSVKCYEASTMLPFPDCEMVAFILTYTTEMQSRGGNMSENDSSSILTLNAFNPMHFMVTTSAGRFEEEFLLKKKPLKPGLIMIDGALIDLETITSASAQAHFIEEQLQKGTAKSKGQFLLELTRETHEKRHFFDIVSTTLGYELFFLNWNTIRFFFDLLTVVQTIGINLEIPIRKWVNHPDCPKWASVFLEQYQNKTNFLYDCTPGKITKFPVDQFPVYAQGREYLSGLRLPERRGYRPYLGIPDGTKMVAYPISIPDLLEAAAWNQQFIIMNKIDGEIAANYWEEQRIQNPSPKFPLHLILASLFACKGVREDMSKMFDFSLLPPLTIDGRPEKNLDSMQYDPPWRFYTLWQYMIQNKSLDLESAIKRMCKDKKWMQPNEVIRDARKRVKDMKEKLKSGRLALDPDTNLGLVLGDYLNYFDRIISAREKTCLFGGPDDKKYKELLRDNEPPLHRLILSNGKMIFWENEAIHQTAWIDFYHLSHIMRDSVDQEYIKCPYSIKKNPAKIPGNGRCTCELERDQCHIASFFDRLGVKVKGLTG